ncbi:hypothetical protein HMPREF1981_01803 [Bacteroides pyogenes F0041]|uniref:Uncharacterized protein n=1 Tax=Bacteroides pyogenes F0041 TaxID=1321819 RepID=U2CLE5_9BACE|nr:hypothetical protein HMPREF1981_01803 [Bacteroides pyogenes F0041]
MCRESVVVLQLLCPEEVELNKNYAGLLAFLCRCTGSIGAKSELEVFRRNTTESVIKNIESPIPIRRYGAPNVFYLLLSACQLLAGLGVRAAEYLLPAVMLICPPQDSIKCFLGNSEFAFS